MKKYRVKDLKELNSDNPYYEELKGELTLLKKWAKHGIEKCKVSSVSGYEIIVNADNLEVLKKKSNKNKKK